LRRVDIVILEEEELVDAIFVERGRLDEQVHRKRKLLFNYKVLLAPDLMDV
jgi:hypothetical protein